MSSHIKPTRLILGTVWLIAIIIIYSYSPAVSVTHAAPSAQTGMKVCQNFDIVYLLDLSGSMNWSYGGSGSRLDAAKGAIVSMNDILLEDKVKNGGESGVRASLLTWRNRSLNVAVDLTDDFGGISGVVNGLSASGTTPTATAFNETRQYLLNHSDPDRQQIVLLITDGIPTTDLDGYYYYDYYVNNVPVIKNPSASPENFNFHSESKVRNSGAYFYGNRRYAGHPLADAMNSINGLVSTVDGVTIHSIAILGTDFRQDLLYFAADKGDGEYFGASTANQLAGSIQQAVYEGDCDSTLKIDVDNTDTFMLGGEPKVVDPNLTVTGQNEEVKSATVEILANHDQQNDLLFIGNSPSDSGTVNGLTWWRDNQSGNLEIVGVASPETYEDVLRQVNFSNAAQSNTETNMGQRKIRFEIDSAISNVIPTEDLYDDGFMNIAYLDGSDYGDAPASYGAAAQRADMFFRLGSSVDVEGSAPFSYDAGGDDFSQMDDEDGVIFSNTPFERGVINSATVTFLNTNKPDAYLQAWIDLDQNGQFDPYDDITGSALMLNQGPSAQSIALSFVIPGDAACGETIARFRLSTAPVGASSVENSLRGEVEDHAVNISCQPPVIPEPTFDYGDGPEVYGAAEHTIIDGMHLGNGVDGEAVPMHSFDATGDDKTGTDDEDGVLFPSGQTGILGQSVQFEVSATNSVYLQAYVNGWADWNQNGVFDASEQILSNERIAKGSSPVMLSRWLTVPVDAACHDTTIRFRISGSSVGSTEAVISGEAEDYNFYVNCDADLEIEIIPDPQPVQLEETIMIEAVAKNYGPNFAKQVTTTVTLPPAIDIQTLAPANSWVCVMRPDQLQVDCSKPMLDNGAHETIFTVDARIPGIYPADQVAGSGVIRSIFPDPDPSNNETSYAVDVQKVWTNDGIPYVDMTYFTNTIFDNSLDLGDDNQRDFMIDELIQNPFQVPLSLLPGLHLEVPPLLIAEYCETHDTLGCRSSDAIITGTVKLNQYDVDSLILQEIDESRSVPQDAPGTSNLVTDTVTINYGLTGDGRYLDGDLDRCLEWITGYDVANCQTYYATFSTYPDQSQYEWAPSEYVELIFQSAGGRVIDCSSAVGHCLRFVDAKPGVYRMSGVIRGEMIFYDPTYERIGADPHVTSFDYSYSIFVRVLSPFTEADQ